MESFEQIQELTRATPVKPTGVFCRGGNLEIVDGVIRCTSIGNCEHYDFFGHYRPEYYELASKAQNLQKWIRGQGINWPHLDILTMKSLDFIQKYGFPLNEGERDRVDLACTFGPRPYISLNRLQLEQDTYKVFLQLVSLQRQKRYEVGNEIISNNRTLLQNVADDFELRDSVDRNSVYGVMTRLFELKTVGVRPWLRLNAFGDNDNFWYFPNLLSALYLIPWLEVQQKNYLATCRECLEWFYVGRRKRFCSDPCKNRFYVKANKKKKAIEKKGAIEHGTR